MSGSSETDPASPCADRNGKADASNTIRTRAGRTGLIGGPGRIAIRATARRYLPPRLSELGSFELHRGHAEPVPGLPAIAGWPPAPPAPSPGPPRRLLEPGWHFLPPRSPSGRPSQGLPATAWPKQKNRG